MQLEDFSAGPVVRMKGILSKRAPLACILILTLPYPSPRSMSASESTKDFFQTDSPATLCDYWPAVDRSQAAFIAPTATVVGRVTLSVGTSIWYGAVVRGDVETIEIGPHTNIQDGAILHGDPGLPTILEEYVTVGHRAVVHSARIETGCLIGIGAVVLDGVCVGAGSIIGAGAVVAKDVPPRSLVVGVPGKVRRQVSQEEASNLIEHARKYEQLALVHAGRGTNLGFVGNA